MILTVLLLAGCVEFTPPAVELPPIPAPTPAPTDAAPAPAPSAPAPAPTDTAPDARVLPVLWPMTGYSLTGLSRLSAWAAEGQVDLLDTRDGRALVGVSARFSDERGGLEQGYSTYTARLAVVDLTTGETLRELTPPPDLLCTAGLLTETDVLVLAEGGDGYRLYSVRDGASMLLDAGDHGFSWQGQSRIVPLGGGYAAVPYGDTAGVCGVKLVTPEGEITTELAQSGRGASMLCGNGAQFAFISAVEGGYAVSVGDRTGVLHDFLLQKPRTTVYAASLLEGAILVSLSTGEGDGQVCELALFDFDGDRIAPRTVTRARTGGETPAPFLRLEGSGETVALGVLDGTTFFIEAMPDQLWLASMDLGVDVAALYHVDAERFLVRARDGRFLLLDLAGGVRSQDAGMAAHSRLQAALGGELQGAANYAGAFLDDRGRLVVRLTDGEGVTRDEMRAILRGYLAVVERADYSLDELREIGAAYLETLEIPSYWHGVDEVENAYLITVDAQYADEIAAAEARRAETGFPVILRAGEPITV